MIRSTWFFRFLRTRNARVLVEALQEKMGSCRSANGRDPKEKSFIRGQMVSVNEPRRGYVTVPRLYNLQQTIFSGESDPANHPGAPENFMGGKRDRE